MLIQKTTFDCKRVFFDAYGFIVFVIKHYKLKWLNDDGYRLIKYRILTIIILVEYS